MISTSVSAGTTIVIGNMDPTIRPPAFLRNSFYISPNLPNLRLRGRTTGNWKPSILPAARRGRRVNKACRVQFFMWTDSRWIFNPANENFRKWMAHRLASNAADVLFLDEHAPGLVPQMSLADGQTRLIFGGGIYEYGGQGPFAANERYNADVAGALDTYSSVLKQAGKFLLVNAAEYVVSDPLARSRSSAQRAPLPNLPIDRINGAMRMSMAGLSKPCGSLPMQESGSS